MLFTFLPDPGHQKESFKPRLCSQNLRRVDKSIAKLFGIDANIVETHLLGDLKKEKQILGNNGARLRKIAMVVKKLL